MTPLECLRAAARSRPVRRLVFAVAALVVADRVEPALLGPLEEARYEDRARHFRFENSDLFALGPLVAYLREHPHGHQRRVLFFGNSIVFGYFLDAADALPAQYQRLDPSAKVFNLGINGLDAVSPFLITKAAIESVDQVYVLLGPGGDSPNPLLPRLIPVEDADLARFHLPVPNAAERALSEAVNHWRWYRDAYRFQAAIFGTSTRQYIYLNKGAAVRGLIARVRAAQTGPPASGTITIDAPVSAAPPDARRLDEWRAQAPALWPFADLFIQRQRQVVFLYLPGYSEKLSDDVIGAFNRVGAPYARLLVLHVPAPLTFDGMHLTRAGATELARALWNARPEGDRR